MMCQIKLNKTMVVISLSWMENLGRARNNLFTFLLGGEGGEGGSGAVVLGRARECDHESFRNLSRQFRSNGVLPEERPWSTKNNISGSTMIVTSMI